MSILASLRESAAPAVAVEIASGRVSAASLEWRGGQPVVAAHATEPLPDGALVPSLTGANIHDRAGGRRRRSAACSSESAARGASASSCRIRSPRSRSCASSRCPPARRISISSCAGRSARPRRFRSRRRRSATCRACAPPTARSSSCRWRGATSSRNTRALCAEAGAHAGIVDLATFNVINAVLAGDGRAGGRLAARQRRARLRVDRDPARPAPDLLPQPRGRRRRHAGRPRAPDGDVLRGSAEGRRLRARDPRRRVGEARAAPPSRAGAPQPRGSPDDAGGDRRPADGGGAHRSHLAPRRRCSTRWRRSSACCCGIGRAA